MASGRIAHYEILEQIGRGAMGVVYRAWDTRLERPVALKILPSGLSFDPGLRARFLREARAAAKLNHPAIATIHEAADGRLEGELFENTDGELFEGSDGALLGPFRDVLYIAMELVEGEDLQRSLRAEVPLKDAFDFAIQIADALDSAHRAGVVHRDLKPQNIRVTPEGRVKVLDFGLAKIFEAPDLAAERPGESLLTTEGMIVGTVPYIAPENLEGSGGDPRSDLFSFGVILYRMFGGVPPFSGKSLVAYIRDLNEGEPEPLRDLRPEIPRGLDPLVERLLRREPRDRPTSAAEVAEGLRALARGLPLPSWEGTAAQERSTVVTVPDEPGPDPGAGPPVRRRRPRWPLTAALVLTALVVLGLVERLKNQVETAGDRRRIQVRGFAGEAAGEVDCEAIRSHLVGGIQEIPGHRVVTGEGGARPGRILDGDCRRLNEEIFTVDVELSDAASGDVLWSHGFDRRQLDIDALRSEIRHQVTRYLTVASELEESSGGGSGEALELFIRAERLLDERRDAESHREAEALFRRALEVDPLFARARAGLSHALWRLSDATRDEASLAAAETAAEEALKLAPKLPEARVAQARVMRGRGRTYTSIELLSELLAEGPPSGIADSLHLELGNGYSRQGEQEKAEQSFRLAIQERPGFWRHWNQLGSFFLEERSDLQAAQEAFERAARLAPPEVIWPLENLGTARYAKGDCEGAVAAYGRVPLERTSASLASSIGSAYFCLGWWQRAQEAFRQAINLQPAEPLHRMNLGDAQTRADKKDEALTSYRQAAIRAGEILAADPGSPQPTVMLPLYLAKAERCDEVGKAVAGARRGIAASARRERILAKALALCGEDEGARGAIRSALEMGIELQALRNEAELARLLGPGTLVGPG